MGRAIATGATGLGVTIASTFAPSLGLSVHEQRIGFAIGIALVLIGVALFVIQRRGEGAVVTEGRKIDIHQTGDNSIGYIERVETLTINQAPEASVQLREIDPPKRDQADGLYHSHYEVRVEAHYTLPALRAIAHGPAVQEVRFGPKGGGGVMGYAEWDMSDGGKAVSVRTVTPEMQLFVVSTSPDRPQIEFDTEAV